MHALHPAGYIIDHDQLFLLELRSFYEPTNNYNKGLGS
jgi:hypothetical protein